MCDDIGEPGRQEVKVRSCNYTSLVENGQVGNIGSILRALLNVSVDIVHNTASACVCVCVCVCVCGMGVGVEEWLIAAVVNFP